MGSSVIAKTEGKPAQTDRSVDTGAKKIDSLIVTEIAGRRNSGCKRNGIV
jgi:hypothetical protein